MTGKLDLSDLFFSGDGRVGRGPFIVASSFLLLALIGYRALTANHPAAHWATGLFAYGFLVFAAACVLSKRLHDRGRSGWLSLVIMAAMAWVWPYPAGMRDWFAAAILVWAFIELALMPGEAHPNRFGPRMGHASTPADGVSSLTS